MIIHLLATERGCGGSRSFHSVTFAALFVSSAPLRRHTDSTAAAAERPFVVAVARAALPQPVYLFAAVCLGDHLKIESLDRSRLSPTTLTWITSGYGRPYITVAAVVCASQLHSYQLLLHHRRRGR